MATSRLVNFICIFIVAVGEPQRALRRIMAKVKIMAKIENSGRNDSKLPT